MWLFHVIRPLILDMVVAYVDLLYISVEVVCGCWVVKYISVWKLCVCLLCGWQVIRPTSCMAEPWICSNIVISGFFIWLWLLCGFTIQLCVDLNHTPCRSCTILHHKYAFPKYRYQSLKGVSTFSFPLIIWVNNIITLSVLLLCYPCIQRISDTIKSHTIQHKKIRSICSFFRI